MSATAPLVILDDRGAAYDVVQCNAKSRAKSLERGELWIVRSDTGRILPYGRGRLHGPIRSHDDRWYAVCLTQLPAQPQPAPPTQPSSTQSVRSAPDACASSEQSERPAPDACVSARSSGYAPDASSERSERPAPDACVSARSGSARSGSARSGSARSGSARSGSARSGGYAPDVGTRLDVSSSQIQAIEVTQSPLRLRPAPDVPARAARFGNVLDPLTTTIAARKRELPPGSYTTYLFEQGVDKIKKKAAEEAVELVLAAAESEIVNEAADLVYHVLVLFAAHEIDFDRVLLELQRRHS